MDNGDMHGCAKALERLNQRVALRKGGIGAL